jgi:hypothetical protein
MRFGLIEYSILVFMPKCVSFEKWKVVDSYRRCGSSSVSFSSFSILTSLALANRYSAEEIFSAFAWPFVSRIVFTQQKSCPFRSRTAEIPATLTGNYISAVYMVDIHTVYWGHLTLISNA